MPDLYYDADTALAEVPVNVFPLVDDTDFKSIEADVNYNAAGLTLIWHFVTCAGAYSQTAVTPTDTGGNYDWVEQGNGIFTIEIPASGGATINNDTEGFGWFTGVATGILPWRGPTCGFRRVALNDLFIEGGTASTNMEDFFDGTGYAGGTAKLTVDMAKISGDADAADNLELMFDGTGYVGGTARLKVDVDLWTGSAAPDVATQAELAVACRDVAKAGAAVGSIGEAIVAIETDTGTTLDDKIDAVDDLLDTEIATLTTELAKVPKSDSNVSWNATALGAIKTALEAAGSSLAAILDDTGTSGVALADASISAAKWAANGLAAAAIADDVGTEIGTAVWATAARTLTSAASFQVKKNTELVAFPFVMTDSTLHAPATGLTVTATRSIDGAGFEACANSVTEITSGWYKITLAAADLNGGTIGLRFTATAADDLNLSIITQA